MLRVATHVLEEIQRDLSFPYELVAHGYLVSYTQPELVSVAFDVRAECNPKMTATVYYDNRRDYKRLTPTWKIVCASREFHDARRYHKSPLEYKSDLGRP